MERRQPSAYHGLRSAKRAATMHGDGETLSISAAQLAVTRPTSAGKVQTRSAREPSIPMAPYRGRVATPSSSSAAAAGATFAAFLPSSPALSSNAGAILNAPLLSSTVASFLRTAAETRRPHSAAPRSRPQRGVGGGGIAGVDNPAYTHPDDDERVRYLKQHGVIRRIEGDDRILFAELPQVPGVWIVYRTEQEKMTSPERLNLDRRKLNHCPLLEAEENLRLLNYQNNFITKIDNLVSLPHLIFLDLYNNQIKEIAGLQTVPTLRVLMLGKNEIESISNLEPVVKLDVLDLHSNRISRIENLNHLTELRVLNLAGNRIQRLENIKYLKSLTELNLRRNQIEEVDEVHFLPNLQRMFLSNNKLNLWDSIASIFFCRQINELALDGNTVTSQPLYRSTMICKCPSLKHLDLKPVTEEERQASGSPNDSTRGLVTPREHHIDLQLKNGEVETELAKNQNVPTAPLSGQRPDDQTTSIPTDPSLSIRDDLIQAIQREWREETAKLTTIPSRIGSVVHSVTRKGHAETEDDLILTIYGNALETLDNTEIHNQVHEIRFHCVPFDRILLFQAKLKKFINLNRLEFSENLLTSTSQLMKLEILAVSSINAISIRLNRVCESSLLEPFLVFHFPQLCEINGKPVQSELRQTAKRLFATVDQCLKEHPLWMSKPPSQTRSADESPAAVGGKKIKTVTETASSYVDSILSHAIHVDRKLGILNEQWDEAVQNLILQMVQGVERPELISEASLRQFLN